MNTRRRDSLKGDEKVEKIGDEEPMRPKHERKPEVWQTFDSVVQQQQCSGIQAERRPALLSKLLSQPTSMLLFNRLCLDRSAGILWAPRQKQTQADPAR